MDYKSRKNSRLGLFSLPIINSKQTAQSSADAINSKKSNFDSGVSTNLFITKIKHFYVNSLTLLFSFKIIKITIAH